MVKFVEFHNFHDLDQRVSIDVFSIQDVSEDSDRTHIALKSVMGSSKEFTPCVITVKEPYDEVMYQIRSACHGT